MRTIRIKTHRQAMGTLLSCLFLFLSSVYVSGQSRDTLFMHTSAGQPHMIKVTPRVRTSGLAGLTKEQMRREIQYYDRFGNPTLNILHGQSPDGNDLVKLQEYDALNREFLSWLPVKTNTAGGGFIQPYAMSNLACTATYYGKDASPYSYPVYENSPFNRIEKQFGPGAAWAERPVKSLVLTNQNQKDLPSYTTFFPKLSVRAYSLSGDSLVYRKDYATGTLDGIRTTDEDGNVSLEFKDRATDRVLLSRVLDGEMMHDTYYVYDNYGNVRMVLPPAASDLLTASTLPASWAETVEVIQRFGYIYRYDGRNRCIYKKMPGCEPVYTVFDKADRPVFTQDGEQRAKGEWSFSIPDVFSRIVLTGTCKNVLNYTANPLESTVVKAIKQNGTNQTNTLKGYEVPTLSLVAPTVLSVNYYDQYGFIGWNDIPNTAVTAYEPVAGYGVKRTVGTKGLLTGTMTARMSSAGAVSGYLYSVMYYDEVGRLIQQKGNNALGGTQQVFTVYDFPGNPMRMKRVHTVPGKETQTEVYNYTYDNAERLLTTTYQLNSTAAVTLVNNAYDEVGRLKSDSRSGNAKLKSEYAYNVRSWTKSITGPLFSQTLNYQEAIAGNTPCYNGNISGMSWKAGTETAERGYRFTYDALSRLKDATYGEGGTLAANLNRFNEQVTGYDKMGNILGLKRYGQLTASTYGLIDNLTLTYNGNQLQAVQDAVTGSVYGNGTEFKNGANLATEYTYDKNGNLMKDLNKNISNIRYNVLNLPNLVSFTGGNSVEYEYGADGTKLRTLHKTGATTLTTDYCGNAVYENGVLKWLLNDAGYVSFPDRKYHFYLRDHQGNTRVVADKDGNLEETNGYYPFGGTFTSTASIQPYKYNGKELDQKNGLNWYDYGARNYDAAIGRWHAIDPKCEKYNYSSPYVYCNNGPIDKIDPTWEDWYKDKDGNLHWVEGDEDIEGYERIGSSVSISLGNGQYLNAYQNGGIIANKAVNAFDLIAGSGKLQKEFLGNRSPLSEDSKSALFNGLNSRGVDAIARPVGEFLVEQGMALMGGKAASWGLGKLLGKIFAKGSSATQAAASSIGNEVATGTHSVYRGIDASGTVRYVGITGREPAIRFLEHLNSGTARGALQYEVIEGAQNLTRTQARVWEQTLINQHRMGKNGGQLLNEINSIAPKNWGQYGIK